MNLQGRASQAERAAIFCVFCELAQSEGEGRAGGDSGGGMGEGSAQGTDFFRRCPETDSGFYSAS